MSLQITTTADDVPSAPSLWVLTASGWWIWSHWAMRFGEPKSVVLLRKELLLCQVGHFSHLAAKLVYARARHPRRGMFHTVCPQGTKGAQLWRERNWKVVTKYRIYFDFLQIESCWDSYKHNVALEIWRATVMSLWKDSVFMAALE